MTAASDSVRLPDQCEANPLCPLNRARAGASVRIKRLPDSLEITTHLREIGLGEEQIVRLVSAQAMVVCQVCNARLAIGAALAETILVEPLSLAKAA
jgi:Fe2+ transport system protein FeoA